MIPLRDNLRVKDFPLLTVLLVVINVVVFFGWQGGASPDIEKVLLYGNVPYEVTHPGEQCMPSQTTAFVFECADETVQEKRWNTEFPATWMTFFTSMFMHISISHLIGNMLFLVVFGLALEAGLGRASFLLFYIVGGLGADAGHILFDSSSQVPALGASGAISAVMGGYVMLFPRAKIFTWIVPPLPFLWGWIRANWMIGITLGVQVLMAYFAMAAAYGSSGGGVAYFAHFGGFLAGLALVKLSVGGETIASMRRQARLASGDEQRIVEHIETPPGRPAPQQSYPYGVPPQAVPAQSGQAIFGQSPRYAGPTAAYAAPATPATSYPAPVAPTAAPSIHQPDPFAAPPDPFAPPPATGVPPQYPPPVQPDPFAPPAYPAAAAPPMPPTPTAPPRFAAPPAYPPPAQSAYPPPPAQPAVPPDPFAPPSAGQAG